ncbi:zinc finger protein 664-like isoform X2 [Uranotaenia lowii]|uniref:zinc finger protein 664-like isoform X2 n=1 Tax=Uranotaenia lowii TaxID=190385 RepID=UPI00247B160A|nr:zinc finger protein 664-like isoform X2 [Uranotaenia lowii]
MNVSAIEIYHQPMTGKQAVKMDPLDFQLSYSCRICLVDNRLLGAPKTIEIQQISPIKGHKQSLHQILSDMWPQIFQDSLNHGKKDLVGCSVCKSCSSKIIAAYKLYLVCVETNQKLDQWSQEELNEANRSITKVDETIPCSSITTTKQSTDNVLQNDLSCELNESAIKVEPYNYHCPDCKETFDDVESFNDHQQAAHRKQETESRARVCTICGKSFQSPCHLDLHLIRHSGVKNVLCPKCPSQFFTKGALKQHMITHTKERRFVCELCGTKFALKTGLVKHMRTHTGDRPYGCEECDMKFNSVDHMRRHKRTHTGEKPYECGVCERKFTQSNDLIKHSRVHFGNRIYQCDRCEESFEKVIELRDHYQIHSGEFGSTMVQFTCVKLIRQRMERERNSDRRRPTHETVKEVVSTVSVDLSEIPTVK